MSLVALMAGALTGCTFSTSTDDDLAAIVEDANPAPPSATQGTKTPGTFGEPFAPQIRTMDLESATPAVEALKIPDGTHHTFSGDQLTVTYKNDSLLQTLSATGGQAQVSDIKGALDSLTAQAPPVENATTEWVYVSSGPAPAAAACQNYEGGTHCYWVDTDTVGYLNATSGTGVSIGEVRTALEGVEGS
ncbi:hypothetical protein GCM10023259_000420 [Thermocatellispora tengchongensis]